MKTNFYLAVKANGAVKVTRSKPRLAMDEVALSLSLELPDKIFLKPSISATIKVSDDQAAPTVITAEVADNVKQAIEQSTGLDVKMTIQQPDQEGGGIEARN